MVAPTPEACERIPDEYPPAPSLGAEPLGDGDFRVGRAPLVDLLVWMVQIRQEREDVLACKRALRVGRVGE